MLPGLDLLKGVGRSEDEGVFETGADDLQADGEIGVGPSGRYAGGGLSGEVEGVGELRPLQVTLLLAREGKRVVLIDRERKDGEGRTDEEIVRFVDLADAVPEDVALLEGVREVSSAELQGVFDTSPQSRVEQMTF